MRRILSVLGVIIILSSLHTAVIMYDQEHGYGYLGVITGVIIFAGVGGLLIYLGERKIKPKKHTFKGKEYQTKEYQTETSSYEKKIQTLKELHEQDILTSEEYYEKLAKLKHEKLQIDVKETDEYKKLKSLYEDGILTKEEFDSKASQLLKRNVEKNTLSNKGRERIKKLVFEKFSYQDYRITETNFNKDNEENNALSIIPSFL